MAFFGPLEPYKRSNRRQPIIFGIWNRSYHHLKNTRTYIVLHMEDLFLAEEKIKIDMIRIKAQKRNIQLFHKKSEIQKFRCERLGFTQSCGE